MTGIVATAVSCTSQVAPEAASRNVNKMDVKGFRGNNINGNRNLDKSKSAAASWSQNKETLTPSHHMSDAKGTASFGI